MALNPGMQHRVLEYYHDLKLATDDRSDKKFLLTPAPGLYTCIKSRKKCIKSDFKEISLKLATNG